MEGLQLVYGLVSDVSKMGWVRVQLPTFDDIVTDFLPVIKTRAMNDDVNWPLEIGEQVACLVNDYCKTGVIIGATSNDVDVPDADAGAGKWRMKFEDGSFFEYDKNAHKYKITIAGDGAELDILVGGATTLNITDGKIEGKDGSGGILTIHEGDVDVKDSGGGELKMSDGLFTIKNGSKDLKTILANVLTHIETMIIDTGTGPGTVDASSVTNFTGDSADVSALLS